LWLQIIRMRTKIRYSKKNSEVYKLEKQGSLATIIEMQGNIVAIIEEIQYMSALSFENSSFIGEVEEISEEIAQTKTSLNATLDFLKTTMEPTIRHYSPAKKEENCDQEDIFF